MENTNKKVIVIEVRTGDEKLRDEQGYRKDTMPIVESLRAKGLESDVVFFDPADQEGTRAQIGDAAAVIGRVNPGNIPGGEKEYFAFLDSLIAAGIPVFASPKVMLTVGAKDAVSKMAGSSIVPDDVAAYYTLDELKAGFPANLATGTRVLKQNRGSQGSGIWMVELVDKDAPVTMDSPIKATEASDNHVEERTLGEFMDFCEQYLVGENGMLVDMPFMPRIAEGEIRIFLVGETPIFVVHKKPQEGGFSATLGSGAQYRYDKPEDWPELMASFQTSLAEMRTRLGIDALPLIWTADFILGDDSKPFVLGEYNASCVGFTSQLDLGIQDQIAEEVARRIS